MFTLIHTIQVEIINWHSVMMIVSESESQTESSFSHFPYAFDTLLSEPSGIEVDEVE